VEYLEQALAAEHLDGLARQMPAHVVLEPQHVDLAALVDAPKQTGLTGTGGGRGIGVVLALVLTAGQGEPGDGWSIAEALVLSGMVVVVHPGVDRRLGLPDGGEDLAV